MFKFQFIQLFTKTTILIKMSNLVAIEIEDQRNLTSISSKDSIERKDIVINNSKTHKQVQNWKYNDSYAMIQLVQKEGKNWINY